jgi:hypothetical protein
VVNNPNILSIKNIWNWRKHDIYVKGLKKIVEIIATMEKQERIYFDSPNDSSIYTGIAG